MKTNKYLLLSAMLAIAVMATAASAQAQIQTTGTIGSPGATTTIDGRQLPAPDPKFGGVIKDDALKSKPPVQSVRQVPRLPLTADSSPLPTRNSAA